MPTRYLPDHALYPSPANLHVTTLDEPGVGGAHHQYLITHNGPDFHVPCEIAFQDGPISEVGVNGVTNEALLVIVIDRLRCFQAGEYACRQNALALTKLEEGLMWLHARTHERINRNVEGTHAK